MISQQVPGHLLATARTGFLRSQKTAKSDWKMVAEQIDLDMKSQDLVDLGASPMPRLSKSGLTVQDFSERLLNVAPLDWDITVHISYNAVQDDQTGGLDRRVRGASENFGKHLNKIAFEAINGGAAIGVYGACYDGKALFSNAHVDIGANYQTAQSNVFTLALNITNFRSVYADASMRLDDQGEQTGYVPDLLLVSPALEYEAAQLTSNADVFGTANRDKNPYYGRMKHIVVPWLDSTAWMLACTQEGHKPLLVVMREQAKLQSAWFDAEKPDGGWYMFKFYARYNIQYGDWRLITQGNT